MTHFLILGAILFLIGAMGVLMRRNAIIILLSIELMLNAVNVTFVGFSRHLADMTVRCSPSSSSPWRRARRPWGLRFSSRSTATARWST